MLINQDFAHSEPKSPAKRRLQLVSTGQRSADVVTLSSDFSQATRLLQETIVKIDGAYAPSTIRAYRADFNDFINFCEKRNTNALPSHSNSIVQYISKLTDSGRSSASIRRALCGLSAIHKLNRFDDPVIPPLTTALRSRIN